MIASYIRLCILAIIFLNNIDFYHSYNILLSSSSSTPSRKFLPLTKSNRKDNKINDNSDVNIVIRVMQFNVLADGNSGLREDFGLYSRISKEYLIWNYRKNKLLYEITQYQPDIITLQEVDHYYDFFLPQLSRLGYIGYFAPKPTSACLEVSNNSDGCALFINKNKLKVISCETKTLALSKAELTDSGELQEDEKNIRAQNQVCLIAVCEIIQNYYNTSISISPPPPILIGTTHLKTSKTTVGERYRQRGINQVLGSLNMIYNNLAKNDKTPAVILSGDFNAIPEAKSYEPLTYRAVKTHKLGLRSVYNEDVAFSNDIKLSSKEFYTQWKSRKNIGKDNEIIVKRCIDYIFYKPFQERTIRDIKDNNQTTINNNVIAFSSKQVAIALLLRFTVYFFGALIPLTSLLSTTLTFNERLLILFPSVLFILLFEINKEGSIFRPQLSKNIKNIEIELERPEAFKPIPEYEKTFLKSVVSISQKLQPLPQYGNPGFEAIAALDTFSEDLLNESFIPSKDYPSDHLSIVADLLLKW